jgi:hypothetical protein
MPAQVTSPPYFTKPEGVIKDRKRALKKENL